MTIHCTARELIELTAALVVACTAGGWFAAQKFLTPEPIERITVVAPDGKTVRYDANGREIHSSPVPPFIPTPPTDAPGPKPPPTNSAPVKVFPQPGK